MKKEQIEEKAREFCKKDVYGCNECCDECVQEIEKQKMIDLANWALSHQWVSVEDELPKESSEYLISDGKRYKLGDWDADLKIWEDEPFMGKDGSGEVTHWMPIPLLAEEGGEL